MAAVMEFAGARADLAVLPAASRVLVERMEATSIGSLGLLDGLAADFAFDPTLRGPQPVPAPVVERRTVAEAPVDESLLNLGRIRHRLTEIANARKNRRDEVAAVRADRLNTEVAVAHETRKRAQRVGATAGLGAVQTYPLTQAYALR